MTTPTACDIYVETTSYTFTSVGTAAGVPADCSPVLGAEGLEYVWCVALTRDLGPKECL